MGFCWTQAPAAQSCRDTGRHGCCTALGIFDVPKVLPQHATCRTQMQRTAGHICDPIPVSKAPGMGTLCLYVSGRAFGRAVSRGSTVSARRVHRAVPQAEQRSIAVCIFKHRDIGVKPRSLRCMFEAVYVAIVCLALLIFVLHVACPTRAYQKLHTNLDTI